MIEWQTKSLDYSGPLATPSCTDVVRPGSPWVCQFNGPVSHSVVTERNDASLALV
jgi:hypothetical protein